jgi:hypothetical protein
MTADRSGDGIEAHDDFVIVATADRDRSDADRRAVRGPVRLPRTCGRPS